MSRHLIIFGNRTAEEVMESVNGMPQAGFQSVRKFYFDDEIIDREILPQYGTSAELYFHVAIASIDVRRHIVKICESKKLRAFTVIHPTAVVAPSARIGNGVYLGALAVVSSHATVHDYSLVHIHASVGHDAIVGPFCSILPGARLSGNVHLSQGCLVGSNAFLNAGVSIGEDAQVDALTYVTRDVAPKMLVSSRTKHPVPRILPKPLQ